MKRKHFILALVAMLWSFSFSAFADDVIVVNSWAELKAALEANDDVQRSAARQRSTAMRATDAGTGVKTPIEGTPYFLEDFDGTKVQLGDDVVYDSPMTVAKLGGATIDLNGHKVLGSGPEDADAHTYPIVSNGNLLVIDKSENGSGAIYCGIKTGIRNSDNNINSNAVFVMTGGNIICAHENDDDAALVNYGIAYLVGGSIEGAKNAVWNKSGAQFNAKVPALIEGEVINDGASDIEYGVFAVAKIDNVKFGTLQKAIDAAKDGDDITLVKDVKEDVTVTQAPNVKITIDGANYTMAGTITVNGKSARYETAGLTIKNVNFDATAITKDASVRLGDGTNATRYTDNVTVENCTFTDDDYSVVAVKSYTGGDWNVQIIGCKAEGMHSLAQLANVEKGLLIQKNIANTKNGINLNLSYSAEIVDNTINVQGYAVRTGVNGATGGNITLTNNVLKTDNTEGDPVIVLRGTVAALNMTENAVSGDTHISGTATTLAIDANYWDANADGNGDAHPTVSGADVKVNSYYSDEARDNLVRNQVGSISAFVYAATGRISGDVTSNAAKSLLINIYGKDGNLIGTTSLENEAYLSGTPKKLTWRINLGADDSDSWKMTWYEGAPSIDNLPAKVELVVDDAKVADAEIKLTAGGDGKSPVFAAKADADGKILSFIACEGKFNLNDANSLLQSVPQAGDHIAILVGGTYNVPVKDGLTIKGAPVNDEPVVFDNIGKKNMGGASMTFENVTFDYYPNVNYTGLQHAGNMVYKDCTINGQVFLYGQSETFNKCTFNQNSADAYNVWTYGAKEVAFNECTFNSVGKSVLVYAEQAAIFNKVNVKNSTFNASAPVEGKAAIEIDTKLTAGTELVINKSTATGFGTGNVSGNSLWNNKIGDGNNANANNDITVIVDDVTVLCPKYQAKIGDTKYKYLADAMKNVKNGETITLLENYEGDITFVQAPDVKITFDGNNKEFKGTITVDGKSAAYATAGLTIKYVKFLADGISKDASINLGGSNAIRYTSNVTVEGCTFTGTNKDKVGIKSYTGGDKNLTITSCSATGMHSLAQVKNVTGVTVSNCTIEKSKNGIALGQSTNVAINGGTIEVDGYGIRVDATQATTMTVTDAKIVANIPVVARKATGDYNIDFNGANEFTANNTDGLWLAIGQEELYDTDNNITTGNLGAATGNMIVTTNDNFNAAGANVIGAVAHLGNKYYTKLQEAINACVEGDNAVKILAAIVEDVTIVQQEGINVVLEGNDNTFDGTIYIEGQSRNEGAETLTIQNVNFTTSEASHYFIDSNSTESAKRYAHNVTIKGCNFTATGEAVNTAVAARIRQGFDIKFVGGEFTGLHSVLQGYGIAGVELDGVKAVSCKNGAALGTSTNAVVKNVEFDCAGYGIRVDASVATTLTVEKSVIKAEIPVVGRRATDDYNIVFSGENKFTATNGDDVWCVVGEKEYEAGVALNEVGAVTGDATVTLNGTGLDKAGIHAVKAAIGNVYYFSFADALAAAQAGKTITMYADVTEATVIEKSIVIEGNDHSFTSADAAVLTIAANDVTINKVVLNSKYPASDDSYGACVKVNTGVTGAAINNSTFNGNHAVAVMGEAAQDNNTDNTKLYVAKADADKYYYTFAEAVAAAENTVKLLFDQTGAGVVIDKDLTIDFGGKTYTVNKAVGSAGTETLGFQILKDNYVILTSGTITSTEVVEGKEVKMLVQNYANLTVDNMKLVDATDHILYVLSNNSGTVNVVNGSEITTDAIALDACKYASYAAPTVTVAEGVKVTGDVEASAALNFAGTLNGDIVINGVDGKVTTAEGKNVTTTVPHYNVNYADGAYALVHKIYVAEIGENQYESFAEALEAVQDGETIELTGVEGSEVKTEIKFDKNIKFTITGNAPKYALPVITFQNAKVTIQDAEILIPELDARQNAVIDVVNSTVHDAGGDGIVKSYFNGAINIDATSTVYTMQVTTMGYINVAGTLNATWQTNVYGNGMISLAEGATFNTAALHLTGKDYDNRDNTDEGRVGKPATIVVNGATLNVGKVKSNNDADYSYNSSKGINVGTIDGKLALLDIKNGGAVNFYMANGQTTNFGAGATVNVASSTLKTICRDENGTVTLANAGNVVVTGNSQLDVKNYSGKAIQLNNGNLVDTYFAGRVDAFGVNNISGTSVIGGILGLGYETNPTEPVVVNITGNFNGNNVLVRTNNGVDNILNVGKADGERTTVHFGQLGAFADVNIVNTDVTYGYAFIRNDFNVTNSALAINGGVNTYFAGNAKVVLDNTTWNLKGYANIGSYGGYMYGNADVTLKNGSSMTATSLGVEVSGENVVKLTLEDTSNLTATKLTNQGSIVLASIGAYVTSNTCDNITTNVADYKVAYVNGVYKVVPKDYVAKVGDARFESLAEALTSAADGATVELLWSEGAAPIAMNGAVFGKNVTIKGTATVDWSKGFLFVGRGGEGDATVTFDGANLTSASNSSSYGIHVSGREKETNNKYNGTVVIKNSTIQLDYLINKGAMSLDNSTLTVKNGFANGGRPASETENGEDATATMDLKNGSKLVVNNHNGMGLGYEAIGVMNIDKTSTFETTQAFLITAKGTMNNAGTVKINDALTNEGAINFTDLAATLATTTNNLTIGYDPTVIPESYKVIYDNNGVYRFAHYVARIDEVYYESLEAALQALKDGETLVLVEDIVISDKWSTFGVNVAATIDGNGYTLTFTGEVNDGNNYNGIFRFENNMAVKNLTIDASQVTTGIERGITAKLGITVNNCEFIGNGNGYAVIFGEGAEVEDLANAEVSITNSTFTNWSKGVSDNANGEDAKSVTISHGNVFNNASVNVSAKVKVTFTENTVNNGDVIITSYSNAVGVEVQAGQTGSNKLNGNGVYQIISNPAGIFAQAQFSVPVAYIGTKYYLTLQEAVDVDNSDIYLVDDVKLTKAVVVEGKKATLNLNGNFIKPIDNNVTMTGGLIRLLEDADLTINGEGEITSNGNHNVYAAVSVLGNDAHLTVNGGKLTGYYYGIAGNGNYEGTTVTINGGEIASVDANDAAGIYHPQAGTLTVTGGTITGATGIYFKGGKLDIQGGTIKGTRTPAEDYEYNGSGFIATGDALVIENAEANGYATISGVSITGGTFISEDAAPIASYGDSKLVEFLGDGCNALFNKEFDESLLVVGYQLKDDDKDGFYGVKWTNYRQSMVFVDGEFTEYTHTQDMEVGELTYIRASIPTTWTPIYLPFEVPVSLLADKFEVAYINGVRRGDTNFDGELDNFVMEVIYIHGGNADGSRKTLKANYPYFIRSKNGVREDLNITVSDATLYAAANATYDCTTMTEKFELTGTTRNMTYSDFEENDYGVIQGNWYTFIDGDLLKPFRFYMTVTDRIGNKPIKTITTMSIAVRGEEREDGTTLIYDIEEEQTVDYIYDLHGRRVMEPQKGGIYIINGKKVVF